MPKKSKVVEEETNDAIEAKTPRSPIHTRSYVAKDAKSKVSAKAKVKTQKLAAKAKVKTQKLSIKAANINSKSSNTAGKSLKAPKISVAPVLSKITATATNKVTGQKNTYTKTVGSLVKATGSSVTANKSVATSIKAVKKVLKAADKTETTVKIKPAPKTAEIAAVTSDIFSSKLLETSALFKTEIKPAVATKRKNDDNSEMSVSKKRKTENFLTDAVCNMCHETAGTLRALHNLCVTPCGHLYCEPCFNSWKSSKLCPLCRKKQVKLPYTLYI